MYEMELCYKASELRKALDKINKGGFKIVAVTSNNLLYTIIYEI